MRVKYPIDNLENRKKAMTCNVCRIQLHTLGELGYMLKHGDFSQKKMEEILEGCHNEDTSLHPSDFCDFLTYDAVDTNNYEKHKEYILIALDFTASYLPKNYAYQIIFYDIEFYKGSILWNWFSDTKNIIADYIEENKDELPEIYLELMLG